MRLLRVLLIIAVAIVLQTTLARFLVRGTSGVDLILVAVVYLGLTTGPAAGTITGAIAGLAQDSLGSGIIGIGGLAKTTIGYLAGVIGTMFIVGQTIPRFLVFFAATALQLAITFGMYFMLDPRTPPIGFYGVLAQALGNALLGVVLFQAGDALPGMLERRQAMSRGRSRR